MAGRLIIGGGQTRVGEVYLDNLAKERALAQQQQEMEFRAMQSARDDALRQQEFSFKKQQSTRDNALQMQQFMLGRQDRETARRDALAQQDRENMFAQNRFEFERGRVGQDQSFRDKEFGLRERDLGMRAEDRDLDRQTRTDALSQRNMEHALRTVDVQYNGQIGPLRDQLEMAQRIGDVETATVLSQQLAGLQRQKADEQARIMRGNVMQAQQMPQDMVDNGIHSFDQLAPTMGGAPKGVPIVNNGASDQVQRMRGEMTDSEKLARMNEGLPVSMPDDMRDEPAAPKDRLSSYVQTQKAEKETEKKRIEDERRYDRRRSQLVEEARYYASKGDEDSAGAVMKQVRDLDSQFDRANMLGKADAAPIDAAESHAKFTAKRQEETKAAKVEKEAAQKKETHNKTVGAMLDDHPEADAYRTAVEEKAKEQGWTPAETKLALSKHPTINAEDAINKGDEQTVRDFMAHLQSESGRRDLRSKGVDVGRILALAQSKLATFDRKKVGDAEWTEKFKKKQKERLAAQDFERMMMSPAQRIMQGR